MEGYAWDSDAVEKRSKRLSVLRLGRAGCDFLRESSVGTWENENIAWRKAHSSRRKEHVLRILSRV